jgi:hypothetical protein
MSPLHEDDPAGRIVDLRAYCRALQWGSEPRVQSGSDLRLVPSLEERARRIREIQGVSRQETSQRIEEEVAVWMRAFLEMEKENQRAGREALRVRAPNTSRRHFGFKGDW